MTKEKPILFSGPMVRAILDGGKCQTRRVIKPQPLFGIVKTGKYPSGFSLLNIHDEKRPGPSCPYGQPGDRLWVKETWLPGGNLAYKATSPDDGTVFHAWKSSRFMPRWASRITLEITDIRVERVQEITASDAFDEGFEPEPIAQRIDAQLALEWFIKLWDSIYSEKGYGWDVNPWVFVISFKLLDKSGRM